jgi:uncharacterized protein with HEPN domain
MPAHISIPRQRLAEIWRYHVRKPKYSMQSEDRVRLQHMLDAAEEAVGFYRGKGSEDLAKARVLMLAIAKDIEIIGEAAAKVNRELQDTFPSIPWSDINGMRRRLIHAYIPSPRLTSESI